MHADEKFRRSQYTSRLNSYRTKVCHSNRFRKWATKKQRAERWSPKSHDDENFNETARFPVRRTRTRRPDLFELVKLLEEERTKKANVTTSNNVMQRLNNRATARKLVCILRSSRCESSRKASVNLFTVNRTRKPENCK